MENDTLIPILVGRAVGRYPNVVAEMLNSTGVTIDAENYNTDQLIDAVFSGIAGNAKFNNEFGMWLDNNLDKLE